MALSRSLTSLPHLIDSWKALTKPTGYIQYVSAISHDKKCATSQRLEVFGAIELHIRIKDSRLRVVLGIVKNLAVPDLLGTYFIHNCIKTIFSTHWKIGPCNLPAVPILVVLEPRNVRITEAHTETVGRTCMLQQQEPMIGRVAFIVPLQQFVEISIFVTSTTEALVLIDAIAVSKQNCTCKVARDVINLFLLCPSYALIVNTSKYYHQVGLTLTRRTSRPPPVESIHANIDECFAYVLLHTPVKSVDIVHYKPALDFLQQMEQRETDQQYEDEYPSRIWCDEVKMGDRYEQYRLGLLKILEEFKDMCGGHISRITTANIVSILPTTISALSTVAHIEQSATKGNSLH